MSAVFPNAADLESAFKHRELDGNMTAEESSSRLCKQTACWLVADRNAGHRVGAQPDMLNSSSVLGDKSLPNTSPL